MNLRAFWLTVIFFTSVSAIFAQSNRLTNENGQLLWQYNQIVIPDEENRNTVKVSFVFINGVNQLAISLRQEVFNSEIMWVDTLDHKVEKENRVEFLTANLQPYQSIVWKYTLKNPLVSKELVLEKSAILIMNEDFEIRKEIIPEQKLAIP